MDLLSRGEFVELEPFIWCGPQPTAEEWVTMWDRFGHQVATVVKLNTTELGDGEDTDTLVAAAVYGHAIAHFPVRPIETWLEEVPIAELEGAINVVFTCYTRSMPCFFHCHNGRDRTGLVRKGFRLAIGWTEDAADEEAERLGFRGGIIHPRLQELFDRLKSTVS